MNCPTVCLNMIVKNESAIIVRMLNSVISLIDTYCICDTGSTDDTLNIIKTYFDEKKMTGLLIEEEFKNFEHNRNFALKKCAGMSDYILLLDADMILKNINFDKKILNNYDSFNILQGTDDFYYNNIRIIKNNGMFKYIGVTHEYLFAPNSKNYSFEKSKIFILDIGDGGAKSNKYDRDIQLLTDGIQNEPTNTRYYFYLANSYFDNKNYQKAIDVYLQRISFGDQVQEIWYSYLRIGLSYKHMNSMDKALNYWLEAYNYFPHRIENLYYIIEHYRATRKYILAKIYYDLAINIILSLDDATKNNYLFLHNDIYTSKIYFEYYIIAYYLNIKNVNDELIKILNNSNNNVIKNITLSNMKFYKNIIIPFKIMDLTASFTKELNDMKYTFYTTSACLIFLNGKYIMNQRNVNYFIDGEGIYKFQSVNMQNKIITLNKYIEFDDEFNIIKEQLFNNYDKNTYSFGNEYNGIEDIRISNKLMFLGTEYINNSTKMVYGKYDLENYVLIPNQIEANFKLNQHEKNWVFIDHENNQDIIYKWYPLTICKLNNNILYIDKTKKMPDIFKFIRGSTYGYKYNDQFWFIVHMVSNEKPRHYYHMFVILDNDLNLKKYSAPFKFENFRTEYCIGLIIEQNRIIISYSIDDKQCKIAFYTHDEINQIIKYI